ncbi:MAG: UDP-3-O-acyl-N-acetylglucosamine deacetylase [Planctomycetota bacterium]|nr:UDP-3-O-acyl-N-acetylglucosamine deacetylase [Planctomycetota bacterium]
MTTTRNATRGVPAGAPRQRTVAASAVVTGKGLMLGREATLTIMPAPPDHGIVFERTDLERPVVIPALVSSVIPNARRTTLKAGDVTIETVEHCMSALRGLGIDNVLLKLHGPELPCGDGSALPFVDAIRAAGIAEQDAPRRMFKLMETVSVEEGDASIAAIPADSPGGMRLMYDLDYGANATRIPHQAWSFDPGRDDYVAEVAPARTFSLKEEAEALWQAGLCRHLTPRDVLVIGDEGPIQNEYRFPDEPVRHKMLDAIGDLALVGTIVECQVVANRSGHGLNRQLGMKLLRIVQRERQSRKLIEGRAMDARAIGRLMPHRFPMLLVDRVLELEPGRRAIGVKNVTINEPFFQGHYPGTPIMPGVLIVEALAQMGGLLLSQTLEHTGKVAVLLSLDKVKLRKAVTPGDQLVLEVETMRATSRSAAVKARALVGEKVAAEAEIRFMMVDQDFQ